MEPITVECCNEEHGTHFCPHCGKRLRRDLFELLDFCKLMAGDGKVNIDDTKFCREAFANFAEQLTVLLTRNDQNKTSFSLKDNSKELSCLLLQLTGIDGKLRKRIAAGFVFEHNKLMKAAEIANAIGRSFPNVRNALFRNKDRFFENVKEGRSSFWRLKQSIFEQNSHLCPTS